MRSSGPSQARTVAVQNGVSQTCSWNSWTRSIGLSTTRFLQSATPSNAALIQPSLPQVIPQPRCINGIKANLAQNKYKNPLDVYEDLNLVFLNALHYNEDASQIAKDATTLKVCSTLLFISTSLPQTCSKTPSPPVKGILHSEWSQRSVLPAPPPTSPPATQKGNASKDHKERAAAPPPPAKSQTIAASSSKSQSRSSTKPSSPPHIDQTPVPPPTHVSQSQSKEVKKEAAAASANAKSKAPTPEVDLSQDMDVDIGGTPEPEPVMQDLARDGESQDIIRQLEKGLPRWQGFADVGWVEDITPVSTRTLCHRSHIWKAIGPSTDAPVGPHGRHRRNSVPV